MRSWSHPTRFACLPFLVIALPAAAALPVPQAVSPGAAGIAEVETKCPSFHWSTVEGTRSQELVVYRVDEETSDERLELALRRTFPGGARSWMPTAGECFDRGESYAWSLRVQSGDGVWSEWSEPVVFRTAPKPSEAEVRRAVALLEEYLERAPEPSSEAPPRAARRGRRVLPPSPALVPPGEGERPSRRTADAVFGGAEIVVAGSGRISSNPSNAASLNLISYQDLELNSRRLSTTDLTTELVWVVTDETANNADYPPMLHRWDWGAWEGELFLNESRLSAKVARNGNATDPKNNVAFFENSSTAGGGDVLALKINDAAVQSNNNYITFLDGSNNSLGAIQGNGAGTGVVLAGAGNDFAEWLPRLDLEEVMEPGDVVGIQRGKISLTTEGADAVMALSRSPLVAGNDPGEGRRALSERVAFMGQVAIKVRGPVKAGDLIVPSGENDGVGVAYPPRQMPLDRLDQVVGQAWEGSDEPGVKEVRTLVGLMQPGALGSIAEGLERRLLTHLEAELHRLAQGQQLTP
jgi:hypothetical protein